MFDVPVDAMYVWYGVAMVSVVALGVVLGLPDATAPDATAAVRAIDAVAVSPPGSQANFRLSAKRIRLSPHRLGLAGPGGQAHAAFAYGPVTPAFVNSRLEHVLFGGRPRTVFESPSAFARAIRNAQNVKPTWRPAPDRLHVRRVSWEDVNATLVG